MKSIEFRLSDLIFSHPNIKPLTPNQLKELKDVEV